MTIPLASHEVRWFFEGAVDRHAALQRWHETVAPVEKSGDVRPSSLNDASARTDVYLILPGARDMGIKWREGEFQIKGRVSSVGTQVFGGRHQGAVERWMKWSYSSIPAAYQRLFENDQDRGLVTVSVAKRRALRKVRLDPLTGRAQEVDAKTFIDRGLGFELTHLEADGKAYCSLAFEAFPDDSGMDASFTEAVEAFLEPLTEVSLTAAQSESYPAWLARIVSSRS
jgi:hypothetical protein